LRKLICAVLLLFAAVLNVSAQTAPHPDWSPWNWLIGTWDAIGSKPSNSQSSFSLLYGLDHAVLLRKSPAEGPSPAKKTKAAMKHQDLMVVYQENEKWRADYWDSERHSIHYAVNMGEGEATMLSEKTAGVPTYRLTYKRLPKGDLSVDFAIAPPGSEKFKTYVSGKCRRRPGT
jgi:hypothetical protein